MRTYIYVDGFNLYCGALKGTPFRWLDLRRLCELLLLGHQIDCIKYFTAHVTARLQDPDQPIRTSTRAGVLAREANGREYAATGVDAISLGWLTHSARALDIGLDIEP